MEELREWQRKKYSHLEERPLYREAVHLLNYQVRVREPVAKTKPEKSGDAARLDRLISVVRAMNTMA